MQVYTEGHDIIHDRFNPTFLTTVHRSCLNHMHTLRSDDLALNCIRENPCLHGFTTLKAAWMWMLPGTQYAQGSSGMALPGSLHYMRYCRGK